MLGSGYFGIRKHFFPDLVVVARDVPFEPPMILILFTTRAPCSLTEQLSHQGHQVFEAIAISEVYALADQHPKATIIMTADIDPERAKAIQHHYPKRCT